MMMTLSALAAAEDGDDDELSLSALEASDDGNDDEVVVSAGGG